MSFDDFVIICHDFKLLLSLFLDGSNEIMPTILYYEGKVQPNAISILVKESRRIKAWTSKWVDAVLENRTIIKEVARKLKELW